MIWKTNTVSNYVCAIVYILICCGVTCAAAIGLGHFGFDFLQLTRGFVIGYDRSYVLLCGRSPPFAHPSIPPSINLQIRSSYINVSCPHFWLSMYAALPDVFLIYFLIDICLVAGSFFCMTSYWCTYLLSPCCGKCNKTGVMQNVMLLISTRNPGRFSRSGTNPEGSCCVIERRHMDQS